MNLHDRFGTSALAAAVTAAVGYIFLRYVALAQCYDRLSFDSQIQTGASSATGAAVAGFVGFFLCFLALTARPDGATGESNGSERLAKLAVLASIGWFILVLFYALVNSADFCSVWGFRKLLAYALLVPSLLGLGVVSKIWLDR